MLNSNLITIEKPAAGLAYGRFPPHLLFNVTISIHVPVESTKTTIILYHKIQYRRDLVVV